MATDWPVVRFDAVCDISRGASPRPIHEWISEHGVPWVKIADATAATAAGSRYIRRTRECIRPEGRSKSVAVRPGDLVLSNSATPGLPMFMGIEACIHDGWMLLRNFRGLNKLFAYYLLLNERPALVAQGTGTVFTNLKTSILKNHQIRLPPLPEQRAIAHILGTLDDKIELNRAMNETLEEMARSIFKSWFVDFDPVRAKAEGRQPEGMSPEIAELFPDSFEESELGKIPAGWEVSSVGVYFQVTMGQSPPGRTYNEDGIGTPFFQGRRDFAFRYPQRRVYCTEPKRMALAGDALVSVRAPVGDLNMAWEECCIGRGVAAIRHESGSRSFTYYAMHNLGNEFRRYEGEGTVFGSINRKQFFDLPHVGVPGPLVDAFENLAGPMDSRIRSNTQETATLVALRDTLLPKLLSGEIRVPEAEQLADEVA